MGRLGCLLEEGTFSGEKDHYIYLLVDVQTVVIGIGKCCSDLCCVGEGWGGWQDWN